ncbi:alpha-1-antiproteinase 2-like [Brachionichthys hirsutus]|uniref:alpha-1-antiproteinase 2-like n=1 Tax=Brachionichthys hirsutus TaxID=412623 RepID=UPI003604CD45
MARGAAMVSDTYGCLTVLVLLAGCAGDDSTLPQPEKFITGPLQKQQELIWRQQLNTSALNTALAFDPYHDLAARTSAVPGAQQEQEQQRNILFSPIGLASALALLSRVTGSESRSQALEALGLQANSTEQSYEATVSALTNLLHSLALQEGGDGSGIQGSKSEDGNGTADWSGAAAEAQHEGMDAGKRADLDDGRTEDGAHAGGQLRIWSGLHVEGKPSQDYDNVLSRTWHNGPPLFNASLEALMKDLQSSDKLELNSYVYFKASQPFERRQTVPRPFKLNATTSVEVEMMFKDDSSEVMMLYDTNCSATVVRLGLAETERLASLLLLPKAELQPVEDCLSDSRMSFWLSNLKPGRAEILFPKFQLRKSYSLESLLRNSGVSTVFSESADFSGISQQTLRLVKASHEVLLEVEETRSEDRGRPDIMLDFSVPPRITFNRPFMLIIYDDLTGLVLLIGRVIDPTE